MAILTQTGGSGATGDLTNAIGNPRLSLLCPASDSTVSTSIVADVLTRAEAEVLSIIGPSYDTVTAAAKTVIKVHATDIAIYRCYQRVTEFRNDRGEPVVKPDYVDAVAALKEIAKGIRDMGDETTTGKAATVSGVVNYSTKAFIVEIDEATTGPVGGF